MIRRAVFVCVFSRCLNLPQRFPTPAEELGAAEFLQRDAVFFRAVAREEFRDEGVHRFTRDGAREVPEFHGDFSVVLGREGEDEEVVGVVMAHSAASSLATTMARRKRVRRVPRRERQKPMRQSAAERISFRVMSPRTFATGMEIFPRAAVSKVKMSVWVWFMVIFLSGRMHNCGMAFGHAF